MLVLSRQRDETIMIGDDIEITIVDIRGDKVRLGITAPATIPVHRKEVYDAIQRENRAASQVKMEDLQSLPKGVVKPGSVPPGLHRPKPPLPPPARPGPAGQPQDPAHGASNGTLPANKIPPVAPPAPPAASNGGSPPPTPST